MGIERVAVGVQKPDAGACCADTEVEYFAFAGDARDVRERNRLDPTNAGTELLGLVSHLANQPGSSVSKLALRACLRQLVEDEQVARQTAVDRHRDVTIVE